jgi:hypothetical protein
MEPSNMNTEPLQASAPLTAVNSVLETTTKRKRRKGRACEELARQAGVSVHMARQIIEVYQYDRELLNEIILGRAKLIDLVKTVRLLRGIKPRHRDDRTFEERVVRSFENWTHRWAMETMPQVREIIHRITEER